MEAASETAKNIEDVNAVSADLGFLHIDDLCYNDIVQQAEAGLQMDYQVPDHAKVLKVEGEYKVMIKATALLEELEYKIHKIFDIIRHNYGPRFSLLNFYTENDPIVYARAARKIGNETDLTRVDLQGVLSFTKNRCFKSQTTFFAGPKLPEDVLQPTLHACDIVIDLDLAKKKLLDVVETKMLLIAPNLSAIVGTAVAAKLMVSAGGLAALANMPVSGIQRLGIKAKILAGAPPSLRVGYIMESELFQRTDQLSKMLACRLLAEMSIRAAQVDSTGRDPTGKTGRTFLEEIRQQLPFDLESILPSKPNQLIFPNNIKRMVDSLEKEFDRKFLSGDISRFIIRQRKQRM